MSLHALSPFSETGPADSPFGAGVGGARRATIASGSTLFTVPFGGPATGSSVPPREASPFGGDNVQFNASPFGQPPTGDDVAHEEPQIPSYALGRRTSVSAESLVPANHRSLPPTGALESTLEEDESTPNPSVTPMPVFPKSPEQLARIRAAIKPNFLFANLDEEQEADVLSAMKEVTLAPGGAHHRARRRGRLLLRRREREARRVRQEGGTGVRRGKGRQPEARQEGRHLHRGIFLRRAGTHAQVSGSHDEVFRNSC